MYFIIRRKKMQLFKTIHKNINELTLIFFVMSGGSVALRAILGATYYIIARIPTAEVQVCTNVVALRKIAILLAP